MEDRRFPKRRFAAALVPVIVMAMASPGLAQAVRDPIEIPKIRPARAEPVGPVQTPVFAPAQSSVPISSNSRFNRDQQISLHNINRYFNSFDKMEGEFIQFGPDGSQLEGVFFLDKPGKIRFHYKPPARLDIIADGSSVAIRNTRAETQDLYPLSQTPLRHLLSNNIDLTSDQLVSSIREEPDLISLTIVEQSRLVEGSLTMIFDRKTYELRQWIVTDAQGLNTSVAIYNTRTGRSQQRGIYRIDLSPFD